MTMDRMGTSSHVGIQVGFTKGDDVDLSDGFAMRFNPYGQVFMPNRIAAVYGQLALSHLSSGDGESGTGVGNLELGGLFLPYGDSRLILRAGLALPTASNDDLPDVLANFAAGNERLTDFVLIVPEYTTLRLSASTIQQMDNFFLRVDGGFDLVFSKPGGSDDAPSVFFRANIAGGIRTSVVDIAVELVNLAFVDGEVDGGITQRFLHTAALSLRTQGENQFHFGPVFPLDNDTRGEVWILSFGYLRPFN
jgi:hypothetical protein